MLPAAGFNQSMQSILAKQQSHQDSSQEDGPQETDSDVDIDGVKESMPKSGIQDIRALNNRLTKLALAHSIHLVQSDQLLLLLDALDSTMQQGDSLLVGTCAQVSCLMRSYAIEADKETHVEDVNLPCIYASQFLVLGHCCSSGAWICTASQATMHSQY